MYSICRKVILSSVLAMLSFGCQSTKSGHHSMEYANKAHSDSNKSHKMMIFFDFDSSIVTEDSSETLGEVISLLEQHPSKTLCLVGHADDRGSKRYNLTLSKKRAIAIKQFIKDCQNKDYTFKVKGAGEGHPLFTGKNSDAWSKNRRVDISIVDSELQCPSY